MTPTPLKETPLQFWRGRVSPRQYEWHQGRIMNALYREAGQRHQVVIGCQSDFNSRRFNPQIEQRPERVLHGQLSLT
jgi:hypothetical protein